jgi:serine protease Do
MNAPFVPLRGPRLQGLILCVLIPLTACNASPASQGSPAEAAQTVAEDLEPSTDTLGVAHLQQELAGSRRNAIVIAAERVGPAVVSVNTVRRTRVVPRSLMEQLLLPPGYEQESAGMGSGFIIHESGLVVTNEHVVRGAAEVAVTLPDGREFDASVIGNDEMNDLAVLRLATGGDVGGSLPVAQLGSSEDLLIGEWVVAIGNPLGLLLANTEPTVTAGVISAVGRNIIPNGDQRGYYLDMIQTDASINPGNSGGPLVNGLGQVIGVNSSILSQGGGSEGLGFAIPIDRVRRVVRDLLKDGRVRHAWIGADVEPVAASGPRRAPDVRIARVVPGSPAERAGLREGMVVASVEERRVRTPLDWERAILQGQVGDAIDVVVTAGGSNRSFTVVPTDLPSVGAERIQALDGFQLVTLTAAIRAERSIRNEQGAMVVALPERARNIGLREGDVILQINRVRVHSAEEAATVFQRIPAGAVLVYFERGGQVGSAQFLIG